MRAGSVSTPLIPAALQGLQPRGTPLLPGGVPPLPVRGLKAEQPALALLISPFEQLQRRCAAVQTLGPPCWNPPRLSLTSGKGPTDVIAGDPFCLCAQG